MFNILFFIIFICKIFCELEEGEFETSNIKIIYNRCKRNCLNFKDVFYCFIEMWRMSYAKKLVEQIVDEEFLKCKVQ
jgi:hypothetical protein